ncbi:MAG: DUF6994 family protein [Limnochordia bacterium]|jgi:hypothetical protein
MRLFPHYLNVDSPLSATLARYADVFRLFGDFRGYVEFFLLTMPNAEVATMSRLTLCLPVWSSCPCTTLLVSELQVR